MAKRIRTETSTSRTRTVIRNASTGRFAKKTVAETQPESTVVDEVKVSSSKEPVSVVRSLKTGRFVKQSTAKRYPKSTVKESIKR